MSLENLKSIDGLDVAQGLVNCMDDEDLYLSIVEMYIEQINEYLPLLNDHFANANWDAYGKLAHSVKGASASLGATAIQNTSAELEQASKQQDHSLLQDKHSSYIQQLTNTLTLLQNAL